MPGSTAPIDWGHSRCQIAAGKRGDIKLHSEQASKQAGKQEQQRVDHHFCSTVVLSLHSSFRLMLALELLPMLVVALLCPRACKYSLVVSF